jgi:cation:H+ antiporter
MIIYVLFIIGFFLLIKGASFLVDGASSLAKKLKIPELIVGLTIVAFGTSMPELTVNLFASLAHNSDIALGNILGSNIANILLILGISAIIFPLAVKKSTTWKEIPLSLLAALLVGILGNDLLINGNGVPELSRIDGIVLIVFFVIFLYYIFELTKNNQNNQEEISTETKIKEFGVLKSIILIIIGLVGLFFGGQWIVNGAIQVATLFGVSQSVIGLTIVALGTSLPELAASAVAAYKKRPDIAVGNVVGSNIFNIFWVLGLSAVISPLPFKGTTNIDVLMTILASFLLFTSLFIGKRRVIQKWQGILFILLYVAYIIFIIVQK